MLLLDYASKLVYDYIVADPHLVTSYKMEVLRNSDTKARPLFRVTSEDGVQVSGLTVVLLMLFLLVILKKNMLVVMISQNLAYREMCCIDMYGTTVLKPKVLTLLGVNLDSYLIVLFH